MRKSIKYLSLCSIMLPAISMAGGSIPCPIGTPIKQNTVCTVPNFVKHIHVQAWGGGGGTKLTDNAREGGAGGGSYCAAGVPVLPGESLTITVGLGGIGPTSSVASDGGATTVAPATSSWGGTLTANGGGGWNDAGGTGGTTDNCTIPNAIAFAGGNGGARPNASGGGGGGGGSGGPNGAGSSGGDGGDPDGGTAGLGYALGGAGGSVGQSGQNGLEPGGGAGGTGSDNFSPTLGLPANGGNGWVIINANIGGPGWNNWERIISK